ADAVRLPDGAGMPGDGLRGGVRGGGVEGGVGGGASATATPTGAASGGDGTSDSEAGRLRRAQKQRAWASNGLDRPAAHVRPGLGLGSLRTRIQTQQPGPRRRWPPAVTYG